MVKGKLTEVRDIGYVVNRQDSSQLIDHCFLIFSTKDGEFTTYPLTKSTHASSSLGKAIKVLLGRALEKKDFIEKDGELFFDSTAILGKEAYLEIVEERIKGVYEAAF